MSTESQFKNMFNKSGLRSNTAPNTSTSSFTNWSNQFTSSTSTFFSNVSNTAQGYMPVNSPFSNQPVEEPSWYTLTLWQKWTGFAMCILAGSLLFLVAFFTLPILVIKPQKFALSFSFGSLFFFASIGFLRGPVYHIKQIFNTKQLPFSLTYFGSLSLTLYFALGPHSFILTLISLIIQVLALVWYFMSFMPGGSGLMARTATSFLPI